MKKTGFKIKLIRFAWGTFPWLVVALIVAFIVSVFGEIKTETTRLENEKKAAIGKVDMPVGVVTLTLQPVRLEDKINLPGFVAPYEDLWVKAEVAGQVMKILVKEGQLVKSGQVLMKLDDRDYRSRLKRIEANWQLTKLEYDRMTQLDKKGITAASKMDEISAKLKDVTAQREEVELALSRTQISAPISGRINDIPVRRGDFLSVSTAVCEVLQVDNVKVNVGIPESDVASFFDMHSASVIIAALENRRVQGKKIFLSRQPRNLARLFDLELLVANTDGSILPGMFARVELVKKVYEKALVIPLYAVINQGDEQFVFIVQNGVAKRIPITVGILSDWEIQVISGLKPNDQIIVVGHRQLDNEQPVNVIKNVQDAEEILKL